MKIFISSLLLVITQILIAQSPQITSFAPAILGKYQNVNISGQHFSNVNRVTFGGVPALFFWIMNDTNIVATVGLGNSGFVAVRNPAGTDSLNGLTVAGEPKILSFAPTSAGQADTIAIRGKNFTGIQQVYFGDSAALSFSVPNDSIIQAVVNSGSSGKLYVLGNYGEDSVSGFQYLGPAIYAFNPKSGGGGTAIQISGKNLSGTLSVSFGGFPATSFSIISDSLITAVVGAGGPGEVRVVSNDGVAVVQGFIVPFIKSFSPPAATRFDSVYVKGYNFSGTTSVSFGDTSATFQVLADTLLLAFPGNGNSGKIKVSKGTISGLSQQAFIYNAYRPRILSFTPVTGTGQTVVTIIGTQLIGSTEVRFGNRPADSFTVVSNTKIIAIVGQGNSGYVSILNNNIPDSLAGFSYYVTPPAISGLSPISGPIGTSVIIAGTGFSPIPANNTVYFGATKAVVTAATHTSLTAIVPPGSSYEPLSVNFNGYTGYSRNPFLITFPGGSSGSIVNAFEAQVKLPTTGINPAKMAAGDFDGDGKPDIAVVYGYFGNPSNTVSIYRNTGNNGYLQFAPPIDYVVSVQNISGHDVAISDIDGDGKPDIVTMNSGTNTTGILKNMSTPGAIVFAPKVDFITSSSTGPEGTSPASMAIADYDGDGRPDLCFANFGLDNWCKISWMRNTSANGIFSFGSPVYYSVADAYRIATGHLNTDNKPDVAVGIYVNLSYMQELNLFNNTSINGTISFNQSVSAGPGNTLRPSKIALGDLNNDGKADMVVANQGGNTVSVYRNMTSAAGSITFDFPVELSVNTYNGQVSGVAIGDVDGDGKPDVISTSLSGNTINVFKNNSTSNVMLFSTVQNYAVGKSPFDVLCTDLTGDGKPELVTTNGMDTTISILKNKIGSPVRLCPPSASYTLNAGISGNSYQWQADTGNHIFLNIQNGPLYAGATSAGLQLINVPSSVTGYQYRCQVNGGYSNTFTVLFENLWNGSANALWSNPANWACGVLPDGNTDVVITSGNVLLNINGICHTLTVLPGATFNINTGNTLTITH